MTSLSFLTAQDHDHFRAVFSQNAQGELVPGTLTDVASACQQLLVASQLNQSVLKQIWTLAALGDGLSFTWPEFALLMYLCKICRAGQPVPQTLPPNVYDQAYTMAASIRASIAMQQQAVPQHLAYPQLMPTMTGSSYSTGYISSQPTGASNYSPTPSNNYSRAEMPTSSQYQSTMSESNLSLNSVLASNSDWAISPQEKAQFDQVFKTYDPDNTGYIDGLRAQVVFAQTGLRESMLAHIWNLADINKRGKLDHHEFAIAMHLIYRRLHGQDVPTTLPMELIPPSTRDLSALSDFAKNDVVHNQRTARISPAVSMQSLSSIIQNTSAPVNAYSRTPSRENIQAKAILSASVSVELEQSLESLKAEAKASEAQAADLQEKINKIIADAKHNQTKIDGLSRGRYVSKPINNAELEKYTILEQDMITFIEARTKKVLSDVAARQSALPKGCAKAREDNVASKAAALLAARMAALGVQSASSPTVKPTSIATTDTLADIERDKAVAMEKLSALSIKLAKFSSLLKAARYQSSKTEIWELNKPENRTVEAGNFTAQEAFNLFNDLKNTVKLETMTAVKNDVTDSLRAAEDAFLASKERIQRLSQENRPHIPQPIQPIAIADTRPIRPAPTPSIPVSHTVTETISSKNAEIPRPLSPKKPDFLKAAAIVSGNTVAPDFGQKPATLQSIAKSSPNPVAAKISMRLPSPSKHVLQEIGRPEQQNRRPPMDLLAAIRAAQGIAQPNQPPEAAKPTSIQAETKKQPIKETSLAKEMNGAMKVAGVPPPPPLPPLSFSDPFTINLHVSVNRESSPLQANSKTPDNEAILASALASHRKTMGNATDSESADGSGWDSASVRSAQSPVRLASLHFSSATQRPGKEIAAPKASENISNKEHDIESGNSTAKLQSIVAKDLNSKNPSSKADLQKQESEDKFFQSYPNIFKSDANIFKSDANIFKSDANIFANVFESSVSADPPNAPIMYSVIVAYDYIGSSPQDLTTMAGELIHVESEIDEWVTARNEKGQSGLVPKAFLGDIQNKQEVPEPSPELVEYAEVQFDFNAERSDEISVRIGNIVRVVDNSNSDWWFIEYQSEKGLVPSSFLQITAAVSGDRLNEAAMQENKPPLLAISKSHFGVSMVHATSMDLREDHVVKSSPDMTTSSPAEESKRREAIEEFIETERSYVADLHVIIDVCKTYIVLYGSNLKITIPSRYIGAVF